MINHFLLVSLFPCMIMAESMLQQLGKTVLFGDVALSPDARWFYLQTSEVSPFEQHLYRMPAAGGAMEKITSRSGRHNTVVSPDGQLVADVYSYVNRPPDLFLLRDRPGIPT